MTDYEWFDLCWKANPRRVGGSKNAGDKFIKAMERSGMTAQQLHDKWILYVTKTWPTSRVELEGKTFIPHMATWMNQGRYDDDIEPWFEPGTEKKALAQEIKTSIFDGSNSARDNKDILEQMQRISELRQEALERKSRSAAKRAAREAI